MDHRIKTARAAGCVGRNAITPRVAIEIAAKMKAELPSPAQAGAGEPFWFGILDFGCGPKFHHKDTYKEAGIGSFGYDLAFEDELPEGATPTSVKWSTVEAYAAGFGFNLVLASNVINVQATEAELFETCERLRIAAGWTTTERQKELGKVRSNVASILLNYPGEPRKLGWKMKQMKAYLEDVAFGVKAEVLRPGVWLFNPPERLVKR
ncbi:MAG: hypothetical protein ACYTG5_13470 [Planctomycetota bacterium]|jgi:hypothetical protein